MKEQLYGPANTIDAKPMDIDEFCIAVHGTVPGKGQGPLRETHRRIYTALGDSAGAVVRGEASEPAPMTIQWCRGHSGLGWYYWLDELPEEGSAGPFASFAEAKTHADESGVPYVFTVLNPGKLAADEHPHLHRIANELEKLMSEADARYGKGGDQHDRGLVDGHIAALDLIYAVIGAAPGESVPVPVDLGPLRKLAERWGVDAQGTERVLAACNREPWWTDNVAMARRESHLAARKEYLQELLAAIREAEGGG